MGDARMVLPAFNGHLQFQEAYNYRFHDVLRIINKVVENPRYYGVEEAWDEHLLDIQQGINELRLDQYRYVIPKPKQHIRRQENDSKKTQDRQQNPLLPEPYIFQRHKISSIYDIFALFLSLARAPIGATRTTFYLPWTIIYARWVALFTYAEGTFDEGGKSPTMFQCTWRNELDGQDRFCIGVSLAGFVKAGVVKSAIKNPWVVQLKKARFAHLSDNRTEGGEVLKHKYGSSPMITEKGPAGVNFGNCAETHPFVELLRDASLSERHRCYGFAIESAVVDLLKEKPYTTLHWLQLSPPCKNCKALIESYNCPFANFIPINDGYVLPIEDKKSYIKSERLTGSEGDGVCDWLAGDGIDSTDENDR